MVSAPLWGGFGGIYESCILNSMGRWYERTEFNTYDTGHRIVWVKCGYGKDTCYGYGHSICFCFLPVAERDCRCENGIVGKFSFGN